MRNFIKTREVNHFLHGFAKRSNLEVDFRKSARYCYSKSSFESIPKKSRSMAGKWMLFGLHRWDFVATKSFFRWLLLLIRLALFGRCEKHPPMRLYVGCFICKMTPFKNRTHDYTQSKLDKLNKWCPNNHKRFFILHFLNIHGILSWLYWFC